MNNLRTLLILKQDGKDVETICGLNHCDKFFKNHKAVEIDTKAIRAFIKKLGDAGLKGTSINRSTGLLKRMFNLAKAEELIQIIPHIPMFSEGGNAREGFVEFAEFEAIKKHLPEYLHPLFTFLYDSGARIGEAMQVTWNMVDLGEGVINLTPAICKNKSGRTVPLQSELLGMLKKQFRTAAAKVFNSRNRKKAWAAATADAKLPHVLVHDLRRSACRNLIMAGNDESEAMKITGHKTAAIFKRYNIVNPARAKAAMEKVEANKANLKQISEAAVPNGVATPTKQ